MTIENTPATPPTDDSQLPAGSADVGVLDAGDSYLNPDFGSPTDGSQPPEPSAQPAPEDAPSASEMYDLGTVTVDGQDHDLQQVPKDRMLELARKGLTFDQRMSQLDRDRSEVEQFRREQTTPEYQEAMTMVRAMQSLRGENPAAYQKLVQGIQQPTQDTPGPDEVTQRLDALAEQHKEYPLIGELTSTIKTLRTEIEEIKGAFGSQIAEVKGTAEKLNQQTEAEKVQRAKVAQQQELDQIRTYLQKSGVTMEQIQAKSARFGQIGNANTGMTLREVAELVFAPELASAKPAGDGTPTPRTPDPMRRSAPASTPAAVNGRQNPGSSPSTRTKVDEKLMTTLFGPSSRKF